MVIVSVLFLLMSIHYNNHSHLNDKQTKICNRWHYNYWKNMNFVARKISTISQKSHILECRPTKSSVKKRGCSYITRDQASQLISRLCAGVRTMMIIIIVAADSPRSGTNLAHAAAVAASIHSCFENSFFFIMHAPPS